MKLSRKETDKLLGKLRDKYDSYAREYSTVFFNRDEFEKRYQYARQNKMDMSAFLLAEVSNFEKLKDSFDKQQNKGSFSKKIDVVIDEQLRQLEKYPGIEFHPRAGIEESYMYGALSDLSRLYVPVLYMITDNGTVKKQAAGIEEYVHSFVNPVQGRLAPRTEDHSLLLSRPGVRELEIERSKNNYLKEAAFLLDEISSFCSALMESRIEDLEKPFQPDKGGKLPKEGAALFQGLTGYGVLLKIKEYCDGIIEDFRLRAFCAR